MTLWRGAVYRPRRAEQTGLLACPDCGTADVVFRSWRHRTVEHPDAERRTYLVLRVGKYLCGNPACARTSFTPPIADAAPYAHTSRRLQATAARLYRRGKAALRDVEGDLRDFWHTGTGKSSVLRWHRQAVGQDYPFGLFSLITPIVSGIILAFYGLIFGAIVGAIVGLLFHAFSGGRRDFTSVSGIQADRYNVMVDDEVAAEATRLLADMR